MEQVFSYIISFGASVMMPILFTIIGLCIGMNFGKALKSGLFVGVGFVGLGVVTALLTTNFNGPLSSISDFYHLQLNVFDMGWPAAAAVAYNTAIGALIIPVCLGINFLMLITKTTRTVNIDLWNYWHFAFIGAVAYFVMGESLAWGYFAAIVCYIITLVCADLTAEKFQKYYDLEGVSIPQPFCQSFMPFAIVLNKALDKIPGFRHLDVDAEGLKKKFGELGDPLVLGVIVGALIALFGEAGHITGFDAYVKEMQAADASATATDATMAIVKSVLSLGVIMGAVMELIPRITRLFIDGLMPISEKTKELVNKKFNGKKVYIGMSPALVIGHPTTLVVSLFLIPTILALAVFLPGNQFLPLASLAGMFYLFPIVLPYTKGNVVKTFVIGLVALVLGLYFVTDMAPDFTKAAASVYAATGDKSAHIPDGFSGGALDFASSLFGWVIYKLTCYVEYVGPTILVVVTVALMLFNRRRIVRDIKKANN
ncbi:PTS galactitol transporter subunit IIC [Segatella buccae]|uniref:PTS galactitol transporter subunit IIC n=1 Tax=Segatella buccae TaxID=28126 RepID=UPI003FD8B90F